MRGNAKGEILDISLTTAYHTGDIHVEAPATVFTENYEEDPITAGCVTTDNAAYTEFCYACASGLSCQIITSLERNAARAEQLVHQWVDML